ncbi:hypothetical protein [Tenacibaculum sp. M341]|uniref:hypothetical protein n=1 Tax=Tenacibaculum sp. M341 TaxID=2530339 RepID=UPI0010487EE5|nr:hypothetical protein [Tenacibaculum sp. M341]TCI91359.1 hypothetical protein EYW44_10405 [Tenacibaculum sp. M341]
MNKIILTILIVVLCFNCSSVEYINNVERIEAVLLPNELDTRIGVYSESRFDSAFNDKKKVIAFDVKAVDLNIGRLLNGYKSIDIRTKVLLKQEGGKIHKLFISRNGTIMYKGKYYKGSIEVMNFLRNTPAGPRITK